MARPRTPESVPLWGETLCLDFANSVDWTAQDEHFVPERTDVLAGAELLLRWGRRLGVLDAGAKPPTEVELRAARELRDATYRVFAALGRGELPAQRDLDLLMGTYAEAADRASLTRRDDAWTLSWPGRDPRTIRYAVAADAVALLQEPDRVKRVTRCPGCDCGWLFLNTSGRRRWCSMSTCGSREKMRRMRAA